MEEKRPKVGVGVFVIKGDKVLFQKRKGKHGSGTWCLPGGHLEFGETIESCAARETMEEMGVGIKNIKIGPFTNDIHVTEDKHYITIFVISEYDFGNPAVMEPEFCEAAEWMGWDDLPSPLFLPLKNLLETGYNPFN